MRSTRPVAALPPSASPGAASCALLGSLTVLGDFWTLGVLRCVFGGATRFGEIQRDLGVATNVLSDRLDRLVAAGVLVRRPVVPGARRHAYALTESGAELGPVLLALRAWGDRHVRQSGPWTRARHAGCASPVAVEVRCPDCETLLAPGDLEAVRTPERPEAGVTAR